MKNFNEFLGNVDIGFKEINVSVLKRFASFLKSQKGAGDRAVMNHHVVIRTIFNQAIADGIVDRDFYPFGRGKLIIKFPQSLKIGLTREEFVGFPFLVRI